jgi:hypothetical protein
MEARLTPRRLLTTAAALVALVALTSGCGGGSGDAQAAAKKGPQLVRYSSSVLSFSHPATWKAYPYRGAGELHFHPLVYLSTQPVHDPCSMQGTVTRCGFPLKRLAPGGVLAVWQFVETPVVPPVKLSGKQLRVGGHPAGLVELRGACRSIGADRATSVMVNLGHQSLISLLVCLRGPGVAQAEKSVYALLASTKFHSP